VKLISAFIPSLGTWEICGLIAIGITLLGTWLWWHVQSHRSDVEEAAKDGEITGDQARGKMRMIEIRAIFCICSGLALMVLSAVKLLQ
jgi:hypothetical protein